MEEEKNWKLLLKIEKKADEMIVNSWVYHSKSLQLIPTLTLWKSLVSKGRKWESMIFSSIKINPQIDESMLQWVGRTAAVSAVDKCALLSLRVGKLFLDSIIFFSDFFLSLLPRFLHFFPFLFTTEHWTDKVAESKAARKKGKKK
jgi:hypothetical protein